MKILRGRYFRKRLFVSQKSLNMREKHLPE